MSDHTHYSRREFLRTVAGAGVAAAIGVPHALSSDEIAEEINVLFLMTDQHNHACLGAAGNPFVKTPNLDRLAAEGVRFTHAYCATPFCSPSRASILTGLYPHRHGLNAANQPVCVEESSQVAASRMRRS